MPRWAARRWVWGAVGVVGVVVLVVVVAGVVGNWGGMGGWAGMATEAEGGGGRGHAGAVTVRFMIWGTANELQELRRALQEEFEPRNPDIHVEVMNVPGMYQTKLATMLAAGVAPDLFMVHDAFLPTLIDNQLALPLDEIVAGDPEVKLSDFFPRSVELCRYKGRLYMLPAYCGTVMLFYNKDAFDQAQLAYPDERWTWEDLRAAARKLTVREPGGRTVRFGLRGPNEWLGYVMFIWQNGGELFDKENRLVMGKPENLERVTEAFEYIRDLALKDKTVPSASALQVMPSDPFLAGQAAMEIDGTWEFNRIAETYRDCQKTGEKMIRWGVAPLPRQKVRATLFFAGSPVIYRRTPHPQESWRVLKFFVSDAWQRRTAGEGRSIPGKIAVARSAAFLRMPGVPADVDLGVVLDAFEYGRSQPVGPEVAELMEQRITTLQENIFAGRVRDIRGEVRALQKTVDEACPYCSALR